MIALDKEEKQLIISRLKEIRNDNELTLKDLGKIMGVSEATASRYESGDVEEIPQSRIKILAKKYGLNPAWIMGLSEKKFIYGKE